MISTVLFYNAILFGSTFFVWASEKGANTLTRSTFLFIAFMIVFVPAAIRYGVGADFFSYYEIYYFPLSHGAKESGFTFVNYFLNTMGLSAQWGVATDAFIFTFVSFLAYPKKNKWLLHLTFISAIMFFSFNGIRQGVAIAFSLYALAQYVEGKFIKPVVLLALGALFHFSAILIVPLLVIVECLRGRRVTYYIFPIVVLLLYVTLMLTDIGINFAIFTLDYFGNGYASYLSNEHYMEANSAFTNLSLVPYSIFVVYFALRSRFLLRENNKYFLVVVCAVIFLFAKIASREAIIFNRIAWAFSMSMPFLVYIVYTKTKKIFSVERIAVIMYVVFLICIYEFYALGLTDPSLNPYLSILNKGI